MVAVSYTTSTKLRRNDLRASVTFLSEFISSCTVLEPSSSSSRGTISPRARNRATSGSWMAESRTPILARNSRWSRDSSQGPTDRRLTSLPPPPRAEDPLEAPEIPRLEEAAPSLLPAPRAGAPSERLGAPEPAPTGIVGGAEAPGATPEEEGADAASATAGSSLAEVGPASTPVGTSSARTSHASSEVALRGGSAAAGGARADEPA